MPRESYDPESFMILNILDVIADIVDLCKMRSAEHNRYMFANYSQQIKKANGGPVFLKASDIVTDYPKPCAQALKAYIAALPDPELDLLECFYNSGQCGYLASIGESKDKREWRVQRLADKSNLDKCVIVGHALYSRSAKAKAQRALNKVM